MLFMISLQVINTSMTKVMTDALYGGGDDNASDCDGDDYNNYNDDDDGSNDDGHLHLLIIITISIIGIIIIISSFVIFINLPRYIYMDIKKIWLNIFMEC